MPGASDYIVVGAGPAGCVLANRLTEDPATRVLLIEARGRDRSHEHARSRAAFAKQFHTKPILLGGNTNAPTIMIAERAADAIRWHLPELITTPWTPGRVPRDTRLRERPRPPICVGSYHGVQGSRGWQNGYMRSVSCR